MGVMLETPGTRHVFPMLPLLLSDRPMPNVSRLPIQGRSYIPHTVAMGLDAEALFLQPFGDVVMLANTALVNAEADQDSHMTVAARALLREAERAKRKVEAVWETEVEKHGDAFRTMMVQQGKVAGKFKVFPQHCADLIFFQAPSKQNGST